MNFPKIFYEHSVSILWSFQRYFMSVLNKCDVTSYKKSELKNTDSNSNKKIFYITML